MEERTMLEQTQPEQDGTVLEKDVPTLPGWKTVKRLGGGSFGAVYEIHRDVAGSVEKAAMKLISIPRDRDEIQRLYSEGYNSQSITATQLTNHICSIFAGSIFSVTSHLSAHIILHFLQNSRMTCLIIVIVKI